MDGFGCYIDGIGKLEQGIVLSADMYFRPTAVISITNGNINIGGGVRVTNYGWVTIAGNIMGLTAASKLTNETNSVLRIGGALLSTGILEASASGNIVIYNGALAQTIKTPVSNYYHLSTGGGDIKSLSSVLDVNGDLSLNGTSTLDATVNNYTINLAGNWNNTGGIFNERSGTVIFDGSSNQTITGAETFYRLNFINSSGLYLNNNTSVSNTLTMSGGNIYPQASRLIIGSGAASPGSISYSSGIVAGKLERWVNTTGVGILYPIGTSSIYRPATITYNNLGIGSVIGEFIAANPGSAGLPLSENGISITNQYSEGYWKFSAANGLTTNDYNVRLTATGFTSYSIVSGTRIIKRTNGGNWILDGTHAVANNPDVFRNNLTGGISVLGTEFGVGHIICSGLVIDRIITHVRCNGGNDGSIDITVSGGTPVYNYSWSHGPTTEDVSGLSADDYTITVTDGNSCTLDSTITITQPAILVANLTSTDISCYGGSDGTITISSPAGGSGLYEYSINGGGSWEASGDYTGLTAGTYDVRLRDQIAPACFIILNGSLNLSESTAMKIDRELTHVTCTGGNDGAIDVAGSGGTR